MKKYDYAEAVKEDIRAWLEENRDMRELKESLKDEYISNDTVNCLNDELWVVDSITGNASGSYTYNAWQAEEYLCHNWSLLSEAYREFGGEPDLDNPEGCDVTIRCYLLYGCLTEVLEEIADA